MAVRVAKGHKILSHNVVILVSKVVLVIKSEIVPNVLDNT